MTPNRISVKTFVEEPTAVDLPGFVPVFHRWIQNQWGDGLLIDVADYKHVHEGPGVVLIGHRADYGLDLAQGRPGLLYRRKRDMPADLGAALRTCIFQALNTCQRLERDPELGGRVRFRTDELEIAVVDRLRFPNTDASFATIRPALETALDEFYDDATVERIANDPREPLMIRVLAPGGRKLGNTAQ